MDSTPETWVSADVNAEQLSPATPVSPSPVVAPKVTITPEPVAANPVTADPVATPSVRIALSTGGLNSLVDQLVHDMETLFDELRYSKTMYGVESFVLAEINTIEQEAKKGMAWIKKHI